MAGQQDLYRVREPFAVPDADGYLQGHQVGELISGEDRIIDTHRAFLEVVDVHPTEQATAAPGEKRSLRLPSGVSVRQATEHRRGSAHELGDQISMAHNPDDPADPASPFAPFQPGAKVVADDRPDEDIPADAVKASDYSGPSGDEAVLETAEKKAEAEEKATTAHAAAAKKTTSSKSKN